MRHAVVKRAAVLVGGACLAWVVVFPFLVDDDRPVPTPLPAEPAAPSEATTRPTGQESGGDALYDRHCASCHEMADMRNRVGGDPSRRSSLETFLTGHSEATADENRRILSFLAGGGSGGPSKR